MLKFLKFIGYFLERSERNYPRIFWFCSLLIALLFNFSQSQIVDEVRFQRTQPLIVIEKKTASILAINSGGEGSKRKFGSFVVQTGLGKRKKFNIVFHRRLEQHFPDWEERMNYQKKQEEFYKSAMRKESELKRLRIKDTSKFYTKQELDAIDYFHGTGFYKKYQDPAMKPNIFDTRQTFLFKMHDRTRLLEILNSFNGRTN